jgi:bifunctional enzyme CysN/CysC
VAVVVNKMDLASYSESRFNEIASEIKDYLREIGIRPSRVIPVSAREGDNVAQRSSRMDWYEGPTVLEALDEFPPSVPANDLPLRFPIQDVYKFDHRRILAGRIESGRLRVGDTLLFSPSNKTAVVKSIEAWNAPVPILAASAGQSIGITLDEQIFVERGEIASHTLDQPLESNVFKTHLFWLGHTPLQVGKRYIMKLATARYTVEVEAIERIIDTADLSSRQADSVERNAVAEVVLRSRALIALDDFATNPRTGRFVLVEDYDVVGGGIVNMEDFPDQRPTTGVKSQHITHVEHRISLEARAQANGHESGILWFTGLSGAGKTTLSLELEKELFRKGYHVFVLDGDNMRHGLNADLGFEPKDRAENIRRASEVAGLFADAGVIVITSFISPYRADRERARRVRPERFHEIYIKADLATCEARDPKGLYKKARRGEIPKFTGVSAPYEPPESPELVVDTAKHSVAECVGLLLDYVEKKFGSPNRKKTVASVSYGSSYSI